jgi:RHS repeat-associated protein
MIERYEFDVYGMPTVYDKNGAEVSNRMSPLKNPYMFTGREWDGNYVTTGLYHYRARAYNPDTGRFLQRDPVPGPILYPYVRNRPTVLIDFLGRQACCCQSLNVWTVPQAKQWGNKGLLAKAGGGTEMGFKTGWHKKKAYAVLRFRVDAKVRGDIGKCKFGQFKRLEWKKIKGKEKRGFIDDDYIIEDDNPNKDWINPNPPANTRQWSDSPGFHANLDPSDSPAGLKITFWVVCLGTDKKALMFEFSMEFMVNIPNNTNESPSFQYDMERPPSMPTEDRTISEEKLKKKLGAGCIDDLQSG